LVVERDETEPDEREGHRDVEDGELDSVEPFNPREHQAHPPMEPKAGKFGGGHPRDSVSDLLNMPLFDLPGGGDGFARSRASPELMRSMVKDGCELIRCNLGCIRTKFNIRCKGNAGTLLSEAFVRPIAETHRALGLGQMPPIIQAFMPKQCDFLLDGHGLHEFRIDPKLDAELKSFYSSAEKTTTTSPMEGSGRPEEEEGEDGSGRPEGEDGPLDFENDEDEEDEDDREDGPPPKKPKEEKPKGRDEPKAKPTPKAPKGKEKPQFKPKHKGVQDA